MRKPLEHVICNTVVLGGGGLSRIIVIITKHTTDDVSVDHRYHQAPTPQLPFDEC